MRHDGTRWDFAVAVSIFAMNDHLFAVDDRLFAIEDYLIQYLYQQDLYCSLFILLPFFIAVSLSFFIISSSFLLHFALRQMTSPEDVDKRRRVDLRRRSMLLQSPGRNSTDALICSLKGAAKTKTKPASMRNADEERQSGVSLRNGITGKGNGKRRITK